MDNRIALLVEDDPDQQLVLKLLLERIGFRVNAAASGKEALRLASDELPSVVVCDLRMPEMDGIETVRLFREHEARQSQSRVPVILLTASPNDVGRAKDSEIDHVCLKLNANAELRRILKSLFR